MPPAWTGDEDGRPEPSPPQLSVQCRKATPDAPSYRCSPAGAHRSFCLLRVRRYAYSRWRPRRSPCCYQLRIHDPLFVAESSTGSQHEAANLLVELANGPRTTGRLRGGRVQNPFGSREVMAMVRRNARTPPLSVRTAVPGPTVREPPPGLLRSERLAKPHRSCQNSWPIPSTTHRAARMRPPRTSGRGLRQQPRTRTSSSGQRAGEHGESANLKAQVKEAV